MILMNTREGPQRTEIGAGTGTGRGTGTERGRRIRSGARIENGKGTRIMVAITEITKTEVKGGNMDEIDPRIMISTVAEIVIGIEVYALRFTFFCFFCILLKFIDHEHRSWRRII